MKNLQPETKGDAKLRQRIVLVALTGAIPLFVVAVLLINVAYSSALDFGRQEQQGLALVRQLDSGLEALSQYAAARSSAGSTEGADQQRLTTERTLTAVAANYRAQLGQTLALPRLAKTSREDLGVSESAQRLRDAIEQLGDRSNLTLDPELDSYYLADILLTLPDVQERLLRVTQEAPRWRRDARRSESIARLAELSENDLTRIQRDSGRALRGEMALNTPGMSLRARLPRATERYVSALQPLLDATNRARDDEAASLDQLEKATIVAERASFELFGVTADELDHLLAERISVIQGKRTRAYLAIVGTLLAAALVMGVLIRELLASRYREMLETQAELRAKEAQLRALGDNLPGGMTYQVVREADGEMRFLYVSAGVEVLHGVTPEAVLADPRALYDLLLPEDAPGLLAAERLSWERREPFRHVARSRRTDGEIRWLEFASAPRELPDGRVVWDGLQMDVTERHLAEERRRQSEQRFSRIFDDSPIPIALNRVSDGTFVAVNDSFLKFSGYALDEVLGRTSAELQLYVNPAQRAQIIERVQRDGVAERIELPFRTKSGAVRDNLIWISTLTIDGEKFFLVMSLDMTEQKAAARQQKELEEQLRQAQKLDALGTLAGGIAHDFNNILGAIMAYTELSKLDNPDNLDLLANLNEVLQASQRATVLVRQILSFSRQQKEERRAQQLRPIVKEALSLLRATLPATIELEQSLDGAVGDVLVNATQVHQIVMNLCTNAAHALRGKAGKISVGVTQVQVKPGETAPHVALNPGDYARLEITDTGHGMDASTVQRIFEPFFTTKPAGEGTGLGLSVVHGIVKEYGGVVRVDSAPGRGTTFDIYLPVTHASAQASLEVEAVPRGHGERVLVVDDEPQLRAAAVKMLERLGYAPTAYPTPKAALQALSVASNGFTALVTDFTMPEMTGAELIRAASALRPGLAFVLVSGSISPSDPDLDDLGVTEVLTKPLSYARLAEALQRALQKSSWRAPVQAALIS